MANDTGCACSAGPKWWILCQRATAVIAAARRLRGLRASCWFCLAICGLVLAPAISAAPLFARNIAPMAGLAGFPVLRAAGVQEAGQARFSVHGAVANNFTTSNFTTPDTGTESLTFDGETRVITLQAAVGLGRGWELEAMLPHIQHGGGQFDGAIEAWHTFFGLPDGNRDQVARHQLSYSYQRNGQGFALGQAASGWGDANVALVKQVWQSTAASVSVRVGAKFSHGNFAQLNSTGSNDYYMSLNASAKHPGDQPVIWHAQIGWLQAGLIQLASAPRFTAAQQRQLWFAGLGAEWQAWPEVSLKAQLHSHAGQFDSKLTEAGEPTLLLTAGLGWQVTPGTELEISFSEDVAVNTAPDIVVQFGLNVSLGKGRH